MSDAIRIEVNGQRYGGWTSAQIVSGLDQLATQFAVGITLNYPGGDAIRIRPGDLVQVLLGDDVVCTGYVDKTPISYDGSAITATVEGRSKAADLVDSCILADITAGKVSSASSNFAGITTRSDGTPVKSAPPATQWRKVDVKKTIAALIEPYGLKLYSEIQSDIVETDISVSKGTKVAEAIKKLVQKASLLVTDTPTGDIRLLAIEAPPVASGALVAHLDGSGTNVISGGCAFDYSNVYSTYEVYGQKKPVKSSKTPSAERNSSGKAESKALGGRTRILRIFESGNEQDVTAQDRANFEARYRDGMAKACEYQVCGWRQPDGSLWRKGTLVHVEDEILGFDTMMLVKQVTFDLSDGGTLTTLQLVPPEAYAPLVSKWPKAKAASSGRGAASGD